MSRLKKQTKDCRCGKKVVVSENNPTVMCECGRWYWYVWGIRVNPPKTPMDTQDVEVKNPRKGERF